MKNERSSIRQRKKRLFEKHGREYLPLHMQSSPRADPEAASGQDKPSNWMVDEQVYSSGTLWAANQDSSVSVRPCRAFARGQLQKAQPQILETRTCLRKRWLS